MRLFRRFSETFTNNKAALYTQTGKAIELLNVLPDKYINECMYVFRENLFPPQNRKLINSRLKPILKQVVTNEIAENPFNPFHKAVIVRKALECIYEFLDKANIAFLSGDFSLEVFKILANYRNSFLSGETEDLLKVTEDIEYLMTSFAFTIPKYGIKHPAHENPGALFLRQQKVEKDKAAIELFEGTSKKNEILDEALGSNNMLPSPRLIYLYNSTAAIMRQEIAEIRSQLDSRIIKDYELVLKELRPETFAFLTAYVFIKACANKLINQEIRDLAILMQTLTEMIQREVEVMRKDAQKENEPKTWLEKYKRSKNKDKAEATQDDEFAILDRLDNKKQAALFERLVLMLVRGLENSFGLTYEEEYVSYFKVKKVIVTSELMRYLFGQNYTKAKRNLEFYIDRCLPMVYKPGPWMDPEIGGYLTFSTAIMKIGRNTDSFTILRKADMSQIYEILTKLGEVAWRINHRILNIIEVFYLSGGGLGSIPIVTTRVFKAKREAEPYIKRKINKAKKENFALLADFEIKLGIARNFANINRFYLPMQMDFRGRIYPISPHLNQMGDDITRGLMQFADGKKLGPTGLKWIKIHLANKMGHDKLPLLQREVVIDKMHDKILEIAKDPIDNIEWLDFVEPWQALSAMLEYADIINSGNPEEFVSHLAVHQDGSCNGLQHYAALGLDAEIAKQVNLTKSEKPGDVYTAVANRVQKLVDIDAAKGNELAIKLADSVKRKVVKQTVMTSVYGVTFIGAKRQIERQLKDLGILTNEDRNIGAKYLARLTLKSIEDLFEAAHGIKVWLLDCAKKIARLNEKVYWVTPLGLPVIQPYMKFDEYDARRHLRRFRSIAQTNRSRQSEDIINKYKQQSSFPPNYIHSLDSTHLMFTARECFRRGIQFAAVHDSFWTHACDVQDMSLILRQQYVYLHSLPLLEDLHNLFKRTFPQVHFYDVPRKGKFKLSQVLESTYFFA